MNEPFQADLEDIQNAFTAGAITLEQLIEVFIDNFGYLKTQIILKKNLKMAIKSDKRKKRAEKLAKMANQS